MSQKLNHSKDYYNLLENAVEIELNPKDEAINADLWNKMGDQLEIEGIAKEQTSPIIRKDIEDKLYEQEYKDYISREDYNWHSGYFYRVMKKLGRSFSNSNTTTPLEGGDNSSINTKNNKMLLLCDSLIDICRIIKEKSKSKDCESLEVFFGEKEMDEFYFQQNTMIDNIKNAIDNKTKIPKNTELFLLECLATVLGNANKCGQIFQEVILMHMKTQNKFLTQKQATKFQTGGRQSQLFLLKPTSRDFAIYEGYTGTRCSKCMSFRVRPKSDHTSNWECYDCNNIMPKQHIPKCSNCQIPLYENRIQYIIENGECNNCKEKIELPQALIDQVNS